jgi:hypothetical protein
MEDFEPFHCEDCSGDCEDHPMPNCMPIYALYDIAEEALRKLEEGADGTEKTTA